MTRFLALILAVAALCTVGCATSRKAPPAPSPARVGVNIQALEAPLTRADAIAQELQRRETLKPKF